MSGGEQFDEIGASLTHISALLQSPFAHLLGDPNRAHREDRGGRGEIGRRDKLSDALAGDAEHLSDLGGSDEVIHDRECSSHATTVHMTIGMCTVRHMPSPNAQETTMNALPTYVPAVTLYGDFSSRTLPIHEAIAFYERGDKTVGLMLGAMRPGYLGREIVTLNDLDRWVHEEGEAAAWAAIGRGESSMPDVGLLQ